MNLLHLHYFHVVAKEGGFTHASKALRIQQPAISRMVKQLEDSMGFALFERTGRRVQLTMRGKEVFERSKLIFEQVDGLKTAVGQLSGTPKGPLAFGASEPLASHFVPDVLEKLMPNAPELYPVIYSGMASKIFEGIVSGELEFGLFFHTPKVPNNLKVTVLKRIKFYLVVRKDLRKDTPVLTSFIGSREIDDTSTRTFPTLEKLKRLHPKASIKISSNNLTAHRSMVLKGLGVAVLPEFLVEDDLKTKRFVDVLPNERLEFDLRLVQREVAVPTLNAQTFLSYCAKT